ncbi:MAG TPA: TRAP transporter small permease [Pseudolabrys sp.]|jgi:TRAP-type C4-dicarboxylate transport system permease small subunit|nr:TRAP transporter small permease [Pseudolabrys sp.]
MSHSGQNGRDEALRASSLPRSWFDRLIWAGGAVSAILILYILALTAIAVFARYVLGSPISGVDEQTGYLVVATVMAGAGEALRRDDHISVDLLTSQFSEPVKRLLAGFGHAVVLVFSIVFLVTAWRSVSFSYQFQAYSDGDLQMPMWIPQSTMLIGAILLIMVSAAKFGATIIGLRR